MRFTTRFTFGCRRFVRYGSTKVPYSRAGPPLLSPKEQREWEDLILRASTAKTENETEAEHQSHPDSRRPLKADFDGDTNPRTGEIGGPKKEPLSWGSNGEWTYGGRATDF